MIQGYNNSRIIDQMTDSKGSFIQSRFNSAVSAKSKVGAMRFPGGTVARNYNINLAGYDGRGKLYGGQNVIDRYIQVIKSMGVPVTLVLNVGFYDTFFWKINKSRANEMLDNNKRMIERFLINGIEIFCIELGNEEYLHVPKGNVVSPDTKYNSLQRLLGQPSKDARFRDEVLGYYRMYSEIYQTHSDLVASYGLDSAVPMVNNTNYKWAMFNEIIKPVSAKYGVWHHYESEDQSVWQTRVDSFINAIKEQNRIPISTEWSVWFGDQGNERINLSTNGFKESYESWYLNYIQSRGDVPLVMQHRLSGNPDFWVPGGGGTPYDWFSL